MYLNFMADDAQTINWQTLTLSGLWTNYGNGTAPARYFIDNAGDVHLSGQIAVGNPAVTLATLPAAAAPDQQQTFATACAGAGGTAAARVDVLTSGAIQVASYSNGTNGWVSLEGIVIASPQGQWLTPALINSWVIYGSPFAPLQYTVNKNGICSVRGLIKSGTVTVPTNLIAALSIPYPPKYELALLGNAGGSGLARVDPAQDGSYNFSGFINSGTNGFLSIAGRWFMGSG
jgi:hypothetical protein